MPLRLGTSLGNARFGISTKWPKGISLGANIPFGVDPKRAMKALKLRTDHSLPELEQQKQIGNSINRMVAQVKRSNYFARPCLYEVRISPPDGLTSNSDVLKDIALNCETISFPGISLSTKNHKTYGIGREYAYERLLAPITMTFYVSENMKEFQFFQAWMQKIMKPNGRFNYFNEYANSTIEIFQLSNRIGDQSGNDTLREDLPVMMKAELKQAYPKTIGDLTLGHSLTNQIHKVSITMVYNDIKFYDYKNAGSSMGVAIGEGIGHLQDAYHSFSEAGTLLQDKFAALKLPKLATLLKKKSNFLPASIDAFRGSGGGAADFENITGTPVPQSIEGMLKDIY